MLTQYLLGLHIACAGLCIITGVAQHVVRTASSGRIWHKAFVGSSVGVFVSGVAIVLAGGSVVRACASGSATLVLLWGLQYFFAVRTSLSPVASLDRSARKKDIQ